MVGSFGSDGSQGSVGLDDIHFEATTKLQGFLNWFELVLGAKPCRVHVATNKRNIAFGFFVYPLFRSTGWLECPSLFVCFSHQKKKIGKHKLKFVLSQYGQSQSELKCLVGDKYHHSIKVRGSESASIEIPPFYLVKAPLNVNIVKQDLLHK